MMFYYIIQNIDDWVTIRDTGIQCDANGYIFLLDSLENVQMVARNCFYCTTEYGIIEVDINGIDDRFGIKLIEKDEGYLLKIKQVIIEEKYLRFEGMKPIDDEIDNNFHTEPIVVVYPTNQYCRYLDYPINFFILHMN